MGLVVPYVKNMSTPMLALSQSDGWTGVDATAHTHFFGRSGGGKTTSGKYLAGAFLRAGWGAYISVVKPEDIPLWVRYAKAHARTRSLVLFDGEKETFNFLHYLIQVHGMQGIGTVTECLMRVIEAAKRVSGGASGRGGDEFWSDAARMVLRYSIPPLFAAMGKLSIPDIIRFISSAPTSVKEPRDRAWQERSFMYKVMDAACSQPRVPMPRAAMHDTIAYWSEQFCAIPDKTRGNVVITISTVLDRFNHGRLRHAFCGGTTLVPELSFHGALILGAMPTTTWNEDGIIAQALFKFLWQRAVISRNNFPPKHQERPIFLWCDEAQETVSSYDSEFLSICRSSKCAVVYLSQTLPGYIAKIGGESPRDAAYSLVGKFANHVFLSNSCPETNDFASRMIGKVVTRRGNFSSGMSRSVNTGMSAGSSQNWGSSWNHGSTYGKGGGGITSGSGSSSGTGSNWGENRGRGSSENESRGFSEAMEFAVEPGDFARNFKTGGPANGNEVTGIWFQSGRRFEASGTNWLVARFCQ